MRLNLFKFPPVRSLIMEHFKGEVIEFESDDENENLEESNSDDHEGENSELAQNSWLPST